MIEIFEYINKLDKSGNYRLADKLDNEVRKIYAQAIMQSPKTPMQSPGMQENHALNPNFAFILNEILMKEQAKKGSEADTDTLSPKNTDIASLQKKLNATNSNMAIMQKDVKKLNQNYDMIPNLSSMTGKTSEKIDEANNLINTNTNEINNINKDIDVLYESIETLPE